MSGRNYEYVQGQTGNDAAEVFATVSERIATDGCSASVTLICDWESRHQIANDIVSGYYGWTPDLPTSRAGAKYPQFDGGYLGAELEAQEVLIRPLETAYEQNGQACGYRKALITVNYAANIPQISIQASSEYLTINAAGFEYSEPVSYPLSPEEAPGLLLQSHTVTVSRRRVNNEDWLTYEGCVNSDTIYEPSWFPRKYPPGTLLCGPPSITRHLTGTLVDVSFTFSYRRIPWNRFFHPKAPGETIDQKVVDIVDSITKQPIKIAPEVEFKPLLRSLGIW